MHQSLHSPSFRDMRSDSSQITMEQAAFPDPPALSPLLAVPLGSWAALLRLPFPRSVTICSSKTPVDAQVLKKKLSKATCDPAVRAILRSLLFYLANHEVGPPGPPPASRAESRDGQASRKPELPDASRRPTRFQLLQAKFMGTGREPWLKKTREVGRLIFKDKQGPGRSVVSATINKLLEKTREGAGNPAQGQKPLCGEKPRWGLPTGKSTVKSILKKFLAAEEKEAEERRLREKPPAERPRAARDLLPKIVGRKSAVLSKLREKFEQSGCLCSEASVLLLHTEERKKKNLQRKRMHRPEPRVLCTATLASTCIRVPPARFLACSAEPLPALSVATVVCGPRSWLSHCAKIRHSDLRRMPPKEAGRPPDVGETVPYGGKAPGEEPLNGGPSQPSMAQAPASGLEAASPSAGPGCTPELAPSPAAQSGEAPPGLEPKLSSLGPARPGHAGVSGGDRMGAPQAGVTTDDTQGVEGATAGPRPGPAGEGAEEAPQVDLMVCSSEDETERVTSDSEQGPLFAVQKHFPEQQVAGQIPPLSMPAAQAARRTQRALEPAQITVRLPIVHEMPLAPAARPAQVPGESKAEGAAGLLPTAAGSQCAKAAGMGAREPAGGHEGLCTPSPQDPPADLGLTPLRGAASVAGVSPQAAPALKPQTSPAGGQEGQRSCGNPNGLGDPEHISGRGASELSAERCLLPESEERPFRGEGTPAPYSTASEIHPGGDRRSAPGGQHVPSPSEGDSAGVPVQLAAPAKGWTRSERVATVGKPVLHEQGECKGPPLTEPAQPPPVAEGGSSQDSGENRPTSLNEGPKPSIKAPGQGAATGVTKSRTAPAPGNAGDPETNTPGQWSALHKGAFGSPPTGPSPAAEGLGHEPSHHLSLAPDGPSKRPSGRAAEGGVCKDSEQHLPGAPRPLAALPGEAAGPRLMPDAPGVGVSNEPAANQASAAGSRNAVAPQAGPRGKSTKAPAPPSGHPTPRGGGAEGPPGHSVDKPPASSEKQQAKDEKLDVSEKQLPLGAGAARQVPSGPLEGAEGAPRASPRLQAHLLPASRTQAGVREELEAGERPRPQAGLEGGEEAVSGPVELQGPGQKGVPSSSQKTPPCGSEEAQPQPQPQDGRAGSGMVTAAVETPCGDAEKGPEHPPGQWVRMVEDSSEQRHVPTEEKQGRPAQAEARRMAPHHLVQPAGDSLGPTSGAPGKSQRPAPRDGQGPPGVAQKAGEHCLEVAKSQTPSRPEPAKGPAVPTPEPGGCRTPGAPSQEGWPDISRAGRARLDLEHQRRSAPFAKYRAQSFCDQQSFDLSFRAKIIRANDTFELPK